MVAKLAPRAGFEPATIRLTVECSTAELPRNKAKRRSLAKRITKPFGLAKDELRAIEPGLIRYVQVNDGLAWIPDEQMVAESLGERLYPGEGAFPLVDLLKAAPRDVPWAIETPSLRRAQAGVSAEDQARETMALMRELLRVTG